MTKLGYRGTVKEVFDTIKNDSRFHLNTGVSSRYNIDIKINTNFKVNGMLQKHVRKKGKKERHYNKISKQLRTKTNNPDSINTDVDTLS